MSGEQTLRERLRAVAGAYEVAPDLRALTSARVRARRRRRNAVGAVAIVAMTGLVGVMALDAGRSPEEGRTVTGPGMTAPADDGVRVSWTRHPGGPVTGMTAVTEVWAGTELVVWGWSATGPGPVAAALAGWSPSSGIWRALPRPADWWKATLVVADDRLLALFGSRGPIGEAGTHEVDAAAYELVLPDGGWRAIAPPPIPGRVDAIAVWTGDEVLVWGGAHPGEDAAGRTDGAAYDPATGRWRVLPASPIPGGPGPAVWSGSELLVWGGLRSPESSVQPTAEGVAYDPATDAWRALPPSPLSARWDPSFAWTGRELVVSGGSAGGGPSDDAAAYEPADDVWRRLPAAPVPGAHCVGVWLAPSFVHQCEDDRASRLTLGAGPETWREIRDPDGDSGVARIASGRRAFGWAGGDLWELVLEGGS